MTTTIPHLCDFCRRPAHFGACPELIAFTERVKAKVLDRIAHPRPCQSCGDLTAADVCAACSKDMLVDRFGISLELRHQVRATAAERVDFAPF